mmetsp:Transcript_584/g.4092  ORF Transcript_584/g.4092 Transcript_584/m.4092 type:complete len:97 (-) Transcript_584:111-401(-)
MVRLRFTWLHGLVLLGWKGCTVLFWYGLHVLLACGDMVQPTWTEWTLVRCFPPLELQTDRRRWMKKDPIETVDADRWPRDPHLPSLVCLISTLSSL